MARELFLSRLAGEIWVALREDGRLVQLHVEPSTVGDALGSLWLGRVIKVVPGIQAAFVDIGGARAAFLPAEELWLPGDAARPPGPQPPLEQRLRAGRELLVQVRHEAAGRKGPRVSCRLHLSGRLLVLAPRIGGRKISRRIRDQAERQRLAAILAALPGEGLGYIARSAAAGATAEALQEEARRLLGRWERVEAVAAGPAPRRIPDEEDAMERLLHDLPLSALSRVVVDHAADQRRLLEHARRHLPELACRVQRHTGKLPLLRDYDVETEAARLLQTHVALASGGYLVLEQTEALVSVDVNSGRYTAGGSARRTALQTNLEAADETARQLRLRNLGGMIVVDFIDMPEAGEREQVVERLAAALSADPARTRLFGMADMGLLHLTRERGRLGPWHALARECPECGGRGHASHPRLVAAAVLLDLRAKRGGGGAARVRAHREVVRRLELARRAEGQLLEGVELTAVSRWPLERYRIEDLG